MLTETASQLLLLKKEIEEKEIAFKEEMAPQKELLKSLQEKLLAEMEEQKLRSIKTEEANFAVAARKGYSILNEAKAIAWAKDHNAVSINSRILAQELKKLEELPDFAEETSKDYLTIKPI